MDCWIRLWRCSWVQKNIAQFAGDPGNVTIFGESAGAIDVTTLMASPLSAGLFRRVIAESGPAIGPAQSLAKMEGLGAAVGKEAGGAADRQLEALRNLPATQVADIERRLIASEFKAYDPNAPIVEGWVLPQSAAKAFASGAIQKVDLLVGINAREFSAFRIAGAAAQKKSGKPAPKQGLGQQLKAFADTARPLYGSWTDLAVATYMAKIVVGGDAALDWATNDVVAACPIGAEAALTTSAGHKAFVYRFERTVPGKGEAALGAFHSLELPYVFGTFEARPFRWMPFTEVDRRLSGTIQSYWINFAKNGNPNGEGVPLWAEWNGADEPYVSFGSGGGAVPAKNFSPMYCHLSAERLKEQLGN